MKKSEHQRIVLSAFFSLLIALPSSASSPQQAVVIPDTIASAIPNAKPVWVAAGVAFEINGTLRQELFDQAAIASLDAFRNAQRSAQKSPAEAQDCRMTLNGTGREIRVSIDSVDDLARNSRAVLRGDVVSSREGFYFGLPGTLFAVRVSARLKDFGGVSKSPVFYIFVDTARIETSRGLICAKPVAPGAFIPSIGDQVLIFSVFDTPDAAHSIVPVDLARTIVVQHEDHLRVPQALQSKSIRTIDDAVSRVRKSPRLLDMPVQWGAQRAMFRTQ